MSRWGARVGVFAGWPEVTWYWILLTYYTQPTLALTYRTPNLSHHITKSCLPISQLFRPSPYPMFHFMAKPAHHRTAQGTTHHAMNKTRRQIHSNTVSKTTANNP